MADPLVKFDASVIAAFRAAIDAGVDHQDLVEEADFWVSVDNDEDTAWTVEAAIEAGARVALTPAEVFTSDSIGINCYFVGTKDEVIQRILNLMPKQIP